jgi:hypothetical protein
MKSKQKLMAKISQLLQSSRMDLAASSEQFRKDIELITYCREYQALGEEFQAAMSLEAYCTIKFEDRDWNKELLKSLEQKWRRGEQDEQWTCWRRKHISMWRSMQLAMMRRCA